MRATTLKAPGPKLAGLLAYYAGLAEDRARPSGPGRGPVDYYLDPDEPPCRWRGHGQAAAGVAGEVAGRDLRAPLDGRHPGTGRSLGRGFGDASARGFDATFSAAKSVSALWALSPDRFVRAEVLAAHDAAHPALIARHVAEAHQRETARGRSVAITTNTAETARAINTEIQRRLDHAGRRPRLQLADGTHVAPGDQIATRRNDPTLRTDRGEKIRNRHSWTVTHLDPSGEMVVSHPERGTATLPADYVARHVELGWAVTGYGNQGDTVDIGLAVLEPGTTRNHTYVGLTRGRRSNHAMIPDPTSTLDPGEAVSGMITHEADGSSALATQIRLHKQVGPVAPVLEPEPAERGTAQLTVEPRHQSSGDPVPSDPGLDQRVRAMQGSPRPARVPKSRYRPLARPMTPDLRHAWRP